MTWTKTMYDHRRLIALKYAWAFIGTFYSWGGNNSLQGFDCSGFVCEVLKSVGLIPRGADYTARALWYEFQDKRVAEPTAGCLVFYHFPGDMEKIIHIEFCIDEERSIGASGGGSHTITKEDAMNDGAFIKVRPIKSRLHIAGYVDPFLTKGEATV